MACRDPSATLATSRTKLRFLAIIRGGHKSSPRSRMIKAGLGHLCNSVVLVKTNSKVTQAYIDHWDAAAFSQTTSLGTSSQCAIKHASYFPPPRQGHCPGRLAFPMEVRSHRHLSNVDRRCCTHAPVEGQEPPLLPSCHLHPPAALRGALSAGGNN